MDIPGLISLKKAAGHFSGEQIKALVTGFTSGDITDDQMTGVLKAIMVTGMDRDEIKNLTTAMISSGQRFDYRDLGKPTVDKHSTGGVGDKITLALMPLVASYGVLVPQTAGRGLGITGGTLDKLESIPGWTPHLSPAQIRQQLRDVGGVVCAAGPELAPADAKLYALRDVTGTVASIPLIASSVMSKKIAEGAQSLVLDVKFGSGAFMPNIAQARDLARTMMELGQDAGLKVTALLTDMNTPLGLTIGNANEVREAVEVLAGGGPQDVVDLTIAVAREMLALAGMTDMDPVEHLRNGTAMDVWLKFIRAQGGDPDAPLPAASHTHTVVSEVDGVLLHQDAFGFGTASWMLGAGRSRKEDAVDHAAGIDLHAKPGDRVRAGQALFTLHSNDEGKLATALQHLNDAYSIGGEQEFVTPGPLIAERMTTEG